MEKLRFEFIVKASEDPKSNVICIISITDCNNHTYLIPEEFQTIGLHEEIKKTKAYQKVKTTLQRRHDRRRVWVSVTPEIYGEYMDEDGNMQFRGYLLEELTSSVQQSPFAGISEDALTGILNSYAEKKYDTKSYNIKKLTEKFVIEKFNNKISNISQWIDIFETECKRIGIEGDVMKIEALRLFLEDSSLDWYSSMLMKYTVNSEWSIWKENFCETFADKGWSPVRYAILFKYKQGMLLDYALKKEKLLLAVNKFVDKTTLIDLIATGLPNFVADKIDRKKIKETKDLRSYS